MKNQSESRPAGTLKKAALIGAGGLAVAAGGRALLRKKPKLRIGTPLSKSKVVTNNPAVARKATGRVVEMSARLDAVLHEFVDIAQEPWGSSYPSMCDMPSKPNFPTLYIDRSKDAALMKMPGVGTATVTYKIKRRNVDEDREDGVPLYGANIEIQSLEPVAAVKETGLESTLFLREFAGGYVNTDEGVKREHGAGGHLNRHAAKYIGAGVLGPLGVAGGYFIDKKRRKTNVEDTKHEEKLPWKSKGKVVAKDLSSTLFLHQFAEARDRDGAGRFAAGSVPSPTDYAVAGSVAKKKPTAALATGAGAVLAGAAVAGTKPGRKLAGRIATAGKNLLA